MYCLCPQQNGFRLLNPLASPDRIGETNPPSLIFWFNLYEVTGNRSSHVPFLGRNVEVNTRLKDFVTGLFFGLYLFQDLRCLVEHA